MISPQQIQTFYKQHIPQTPQNISHRHFRIRLQNGRFKKLGHHNNIQRLQEDLVKYSPQDAYVGITEWLNPEETGPKRLNRAGSKWTHANLLSSDFFVDIDKKQFKNNSMKLAFKELVKIHYFLKQKYSRFKFAKTGNGYHLWCLDFYEKACTKKIPSPFDRIEYVRQRKKDLTFTLKKQGFTFDELQSMNVFQIARIWESIHRDGATIKSYDSIEELYKEGQNERNKNHRK